MSYWIVVTFDDPDEAGKVRQQIASEEKEGYISLDDSAVVVKDAEGKAHVKNEMDKGVKAGAIGGSLVGLLIAGLLFPIAGIVLGALAGGGIGALMGKGVDKKFVKDVEASMQPNTSALFLIVRDDDPGPTIAALSQYKGKIYHTSLPEDVEKELRKSMEG